MRLSEVGCVVIGRNEGERLRKCLASVVGHVGRVVYVDSGSTDGSVEMAQAQGVQVVALDMRQPFTAARARNAGFMALLQAMPDCTHVQFVDGDCEIQPAWIEQADAFLASHPQAAVVCGRRRERHPERSVYNRLCDQEWAVPAGIAKACGGDAMMRVAALRAVGGYRDDLIAGEEPELCVRLRAQGWQIHVLAAEMTLHDAAMTRFGQWWMRNVRAGYAYAEGAHLHGQPPERHCVRSLNSALAWGLGLPLLIAAAGFVAGPWALALLLIYPLQVTRLFLGGSGDSRSRRVRAIFLVLGKFPEVQGALRYRRLRMLKRNGRLIEYK
ncbi:MAG TPA: glycosyltransferase [Burkholderiaceae bacterium]